MSLGAAFLIVQLVGGQSTMTPFISAGDCETARHAVTKAVATAATCVTEAGSTRVSEAGDIDWPMAVEMRYMKEVPASKWGAPVKKKRRYHR